MNLSSLLHFATDKTNFQTLDAYIDFCLQYLEFAATGLQAVIVAQNEIDYHFYQYREDGSFNITRPINARLMYTVETSSILQHTFPRLLGELRSISSEDEMNRTIFRQSVYTIQQTIGATLDALPAGASNRARKVNGDLFERLIRLLINQTGVECTTGIINVPMLLDGQPMDMMTYQHDLLLWSGKELKVIGSVKTSSKDRIDKIFLDKFLYSRLTETATPHIAIFLNDVQRKNTKRIDRFAIGSTFLPGHFRAYSLKLNALDGVYYCDLRPNMKTDPFLSQHIKTIDRFFCDDLAIFMKDDATR